jgi:transcriptional regulator with XRE-family HTH domain
MSRDGDHDGDHPSSLPGWGVQVRLAREALGISQDELGRMCGVTAVTIRNWEGGRSLPGADSYRALSVALEGRPTSPVAKQLRDARVARGWTIEDVARDLGVSPWRVARWEAGLAMPSTACIGMLLDRLKIDLRTDAGLPPRRKSRRKSPSVSQGELDRRRRPGAEAPPTTRERTCLRCDRQFVSRGVGNRLCPSCSGRGHCLPGWEYAG